MEIKEIIGEGKYLKKCAGCGKEFRSEARNTRYGPAELCNCAARKAKTRSKRRRERRRYHRDPEHFRNLSRIRAEARRQMEDYLRRHATEPACSHHGCKHRGWKAWKHILQVHHRATVTGDADVDNARGDTLPELDFQIRLKYDITCRNHHDRFDNAKEYGLVLYVPHPESWHEYEGRLMKEQPRLYWTTPWTQLFKEWTLGIYR